MLFYSNYFVGMSLMRFYLALTIWMLIRVALHFCFSSSEVATGLAPVYKASQFCPGVSAAVLANCY